MSSDTPALPTPSHRWYTHGRLRQRQCGFCGIWETSESRVSACPAGVVTATDISPDVARPVVEHAIQMSGGSMQVRNAHPEIERIFPLADWIKANQRGGGRVWRRVVVVVEDWEEVPRG